MLPPLPRGRIKAVPEDFVVDEIPAYEPQGTGDHLFVRFAKRNLTTDEAVHALADAVGVAVRDIGVAGMKDKVALTTQTVSLPIPRGVDAFPERVLALTLPGITILSAIRHGHKLKTGHLEGNRFRIVIRDVEESREQEVIDALVRAGRVGIPNAFGSQRFGRDQDNAARALGWLSGKERPPRDPRKKRFLWSALQSDLFNAVLAARVADGTWVVPQAGDILKKTDTGGLFDCSDETVDRPRAERGEVSPTGPMFGVKMRTPTGKPAELERAVFEQRLGPGFDLAATRPFGEGTRRSLRVCIESMAVERVAAPPAVAPTVERLMNHLDDKRGEQGRALLVTFVLPKGAYATSVLGMALAFEPTRTPNESTSPIEAPTPEEGEAATETEPE